MCGIAGLTYLGKKTPLPPMDLLRSMAAALKHRGPDEFGWYRNLRTGFAHARLSLIDVATGQQPLSNEDESLWIIFNGEIFNYIELKAELVARGHRFRTHSDTEVVVHAFEEWGRECFQRFNGQWALALWDERKRLLTLSRDRVGVRPLYVHRTNNRVMFASEVKALFVDPSVPRSIDVRGLDQTFMYWASIPPVTMFEGIEQIPAGWTWSVDRHGKWQEDEYWRPTYPSAAALRTAGSKPTLRQATERLRELLDKATELRMLRADVPVGSYLSGGLDSSVIARLGRKAAHGEFRTFSIRFSDAEFDETPYQRAMASTLDSVHTEVVVTRNDIAATLPDVIRHTEHPILRTAPVPMYLLSRAVRAGGIKAVLTGEGADEFLAGYDLFREAKIREFWSRQPDSTVRPRLFDRLYPYLARSPQQTRAFAAEFWKRGLDRVGSPEFSHQPRWSTTRTLKRFFSEPVREQLSRRPGPSPLDSLPEEFESWDLLGKAQFLEIATLLSTYLLSSQGDRMLMANSVEGRFPFLDADLMEYCNTLPPEYKLLGLNEKHILKRLASDLVPEMILKRQKQAYRAPDAVAFLTSTAPSYIGDALSKEALMHAGLFEPNAVDGLVGKLKGRLAKEGDQVLFTNTENMAFIGILTTQLLSMQSVGTPMASGAEGLPWVRQIDRSGVIAFHS